MAEFTDENKAEYLNVMHGIQSAVEYGFGHHIDTPHDEQRKVNKHLSVGIISCMVTDHAIATLLVEKGIFTMDEYLHQVLVSSKIELDKYQQTADERYGPGRVSFL